MPTPLRLRRCAQAVLLLALASVAGGLDQRTQHEEDLSPVRLGKMGAELVQGGDLRGAARAFAAVTRLAPTLFQGHFSLGSVLLRQCRFSEAGAAYARALLLLHDPRQGRMRAEVFKGRAMALHARAKLSGSLEERDTLLKSVASLLTAAEAAHMGSVDPSLQAAVAETRGRGGVSHLLLVSTAVEECAEDLTKIGGEAMAAASTAHAAGRAGEAGGHVTRSVSAFNAARLLFPDSNAHYQRLLDTLRLQLTLNRGAWHAAPPPANEDTPPANEALLSANEDLSPWGGAGGGWPPAVGPYFSQVGQDAYIHARLLTDAARAAAGFPPGRGVFFEAGAVDGVTNSNTLFFERSLGWTGVCVEPSPWFETLVSLRPKSTTLRMALGGASSRASERFVFGRGGNALCQQRGGLAEGMDEEAWAKIRQDCDSVEEVDVRSASLGALLGELSVTHIDLMSLDLEGGELAALQSVDWSVVTILVLCIEHNPDAGGGEVRGLLEAQGYTLATSLAQDDIFVHPRLAAALRL